MAMVVRIFLFYAAAKRLLANLHPACDITGCLKVQKIIKDIFIFY